MVRQAHHEDNSLKTLSLILSLSKDEAKISYFFSGLLSQLRWTGQRIAAAVPERRSPIWDRKD
jgi:hypothetical protein